MGAPWCVFSLVSATLSHAQVGALATVGALITATVKMRRGQSQSFNKWLRVRVVAQGLTIVAICAGTWSMRPKDHLAASSSSVDADAERRRAEKMAREKNEFEERLRGAEEAHQAEVELRNKSNRGPGSASEVRDKGWSSWLPWTSKSEADTKSESK